MSADKQLKWFREELLPTLIKNQQLFQKENIQSLEKCEFEEIQKGVNSFASVPSFATLTLNTPNGQITKDIIIKFQSQDPVFRERMKLVLQFQNEVTMYNKILPNFSNFLIHCGQSEQLVQEIIPKCHFAKHDTENPEKSILILDDLRKDGYKVSESVTELDLDHCLLSYEKLAQYHAISYAMKLRNWNSFAELKKSFVEVWYEDDEETRKQCNEFVGFCSTRGIDYLMSQENSEVPVEYLEKLKKLLNPDGVFDFLKSLRTPCEPLSIICHGDFNRNNLLYKYRNGKPIDAKLIDFQTFFYGSPNIDLCFFMYMNTTLEFREKHFDEVYNHYHSTLIKTISQILNESEEKIEKQLPLEAFMKDFGRVALMSYVTVAFFLPIMMAPMETDFEQDLKEKSYGELAEENRVQGGEIVTKRIAEVIVDFYRRKFYV